MSLPGCTVRTWHVFFFNPSDSNPSHTPGAAQWPVSLLSGFQRAIPFEFSLLRKLLHISLFVFTGSSSCLNAPELNPRTSPLSVLTPLVRSCSFLLHMTSQTDISHIPKLQSLPHKLLTHTSNRLKHLMGISNVMWPKSHF